MVELLICGALACIVIWGSNRLSMPLPERKTAIICSACGRVKGVAWYDSCFMHAVEVWADDMTVDRNGRVVRAICTGRDVPLEERM